MKLHPRLFYFLPFAALMMLIVLLYALLRQNMVLMQQAPVAVEENRALPEFAITGLRNTDIKGVALLHMTASWCAVCKIEHPLLMELAKKMPIYGVAWKDKPEMLAAWLKRAGNPYKKIGYDDGMLGVELGITGTPESFLVKDGRIIAHFKGPLSEEQISRDIVSRLK